MGFFDSLVGKAIEKGVGTLVDTGARALASAVFKTDVQTGSASGSTQSVSPVAQGQSSFNQVIKDVKDAAEAGFVGQTPTVGGILPRSAGRAELASSLRGNDVKRLLAELASPQVLMPDLQSLQIQLRVATGAKDLTPSRRRSASAFKKLLSTNKGY